MQDMGQPKVISNMTKALIINDFLLNAPGITNLLKDMKYLAAIHGGSGDTLRAIEINSVVRRPSHRGH